MDADFIKVNMVKLFLQDIVNELGYAACTFDTDWASADKDKGQQSLALFRVWFSRSFFKDTQEMAADADGILQGLQWECVSFYFFIAKEIWRRAKSDDEIVVGNIPVTRLDNLCFWLDAADFC